MRFWIAVLFSSVLYGQHLVFTMVTPATSPLVIAAVSSSSDYGFQSLTLLNEDDRTIESIRFRVVLAIGSNREEIADGGHVFAKLEPGEKRSVDVFLGRLRTLSQRAKELKLELARAIVTVEAVDFSDGTQWTGDRPVQEIPITPRPIPQ